MADAKLPPDADLMVLELAEDGAPIPVIAEQLGVSESTLRRRLKGQTKIARAYTRGRARLEHRLTAALVREAEDGNIPAARLALQELCGWQAGYDAKPKPQEHKVRLELILPKPLSMERYLEAVDAEVEPLALPEEST